MKRLTIQRLIRGISIGLLLAAACGWLCSCEGNSSAYDEGVKPSRPMRGLPRSSYVSHPVSRSAYQTHTAGFTSRKGSTRVIHRSGGGHRR